jgi:hypothetical protein
MSEVRCPFCGHDLCALTDEEMGSPCEHLVADWTIDGGVLGRSTWSQGLPARDFGLAIRALNQLVMDTDVKRREDNLAVLRDILPPKRKPAWWAALCSELNELDGEPGVQMDSATIEGGVMFEDYVLLWAQHPEAANRAITECMGIATATVQLASDNLRNRGRSGDLSRI